MALTHGVNDAYTAFLHPLLPRLMGELGLSIALAATLAMTLSIAGTLAQPVFGYLSDRYGHLPFVILGPLCSGVFFSLIGVAPGFAGLLVLVTLGGLGSAMFHPPGASLATRTSEGRGSGRRASLFSFGGSAGYAAGPLVAVALVSWRGLGGLWIAILPALGVALALWLLLPRDAAHRPDLAPPPPGRLLAHLRGPLGLVFGISAASAFVQRTFLTLEPIVIAGDGGTEAVGAFTLSVYLAGQAVGTLVGGSLGDRVDRRVLLIALALLAFPAHVLAFVLSPGTSGAFAAAASAGFFVMAIVPTVTVLSQEIVPEGASASYGLVVGLAWALASASVLVIGALGDIVGARPAALTATPVLVLAALLAAHPSLGAYRKPTVATSTA